MPVNKAAEFYALGTTGANSQFQEEYLTFAPFEQRIPSFSMTRLALNPGKYPAERQLLQEKQRELRRVLFYKEDFSKIRSVLDIGCGHGTDVIQLARHYAHLHADGYTITKDQADLGNARIAQLGIGSRARIFNRDSASDRFPGVYDLVIGIEVTFHIRDKRALFANIAASLAGDGRVLLMDYIANLRGPIADPAVEITIPTEEDWADVLATQHFLIDELIDVSPQIANFLHDPEFETNIRGIPKVAQDTFRNYANQSIALERGWISYCLFKIKNARGMPEDQVRARNAEKIATKRPYADAVREQNAVNTSAYPFSAARATPLEPAEREPSTGGPSQGTILFHPQWVAREIDGHAAAVRIELRHVFIYGFD
ncbi:MAG: methyltransferase, partial [Steroidobacteraceae bacterium]